VIAQVDGARTAEQIVDTFPERDRPFVQELLAHFASLGIVDVSGRWTGRLLHAATKKGVARADELGADEVERLVTDGDYRRYPGAPRHPLPEGGPPELNALRGILATRRSPRAFTGTVRRTELEAILTTACAVTGVVPRASGELRLRAYPSSGALYAVECYPVALAVDGLDTGVYHVCPDERALELVRRHSDISHFVQAALPSERDMLAQAGALICLTGAFPRHERKYGGGGYRMLVAEAGHLSQTIVLAATALGLAARPFGGVIDDLLNAALGLETEEEQFILGVLVGYDGTV
jgi:SagB-type dehydrogenase family enzyme